MVIHRKGDAVDILLVLGAFLLLALAGYLRGHNSRDGRREAWW